MTSRAGFVLAGGASRRMGRDKALLPAGATTMLESIASEVREAAGNVTIIGPPKRYGHLGLTIIADKIDGCGPIGGIYTALQSSFAAEWNLFVACDMPNVTKIVLKTLFAAAETSNFDCFVPEKDGKIHPLCAIYHRRVAPAAESAIAHKLFKMQDFLSILRTHPWPVPEQFASALANINTPAEWSAAQ